MEGILGNPSHKETAEIRINNNSLLIAPDRQLNGPGEGGKENFIDLVHRKKCMQPKNNEL